MARTSYSSTVSHADDAGFRAWGSALSAAFQAVGLVKTTDTGQVDWATVTRPGTGVYVYEIYRFSDALQATRPVFIRIEYGTSSIATGPSIRAYTGQGSNGVGGLTGLLSGNAAVANGAGLGTAVSYVCYNQDDGILTWAWQTGTSGMAWGVIERTKNASGTPTGNGLLVAGRGTLATAGFLSFLNFDAGVANNNSGTTSVHYNIPALGAIQANSSASTAVLLSNWYIWLPDAYFAMGIMGYKTGEITALTDFDAAMVASVSRHYLALGGVSDGWGTAPGRGAVALLWDVN